MTFTSPVSPEETEISVSDVSVVGEAKSQPGTER